MKILAPVNSLDSCIKQIGAGAGEIYVASDTDAFERFSFTGRGQYNGSGEKIAPDYEELSDITNHAHEKNVTVMYTANIPFLADDPCGTKNYEKAFLDYVSKGVKAGVDSVILGDIGSILLLNEEGIEIDIASSTYMEPANIDHIRFLKELNVTRAILSYHVTISEIKKIIEEDIMEIEVFGHFGCSFYDGYCNLKHGQGEKTIQEGIGFPCLRNYQLMCENETLSEGKIFYSSLACGLCSIPSLCDIGVNSLKLVGRDLPLDANLVTTSLYSRLLKFHERHDPESFSNDESKENMNYHEYRNGITPSWWREMYCKNKSCKYRSKNIINSYVES